MIKKMIKIILVLIFIFINKTTSNGPLSPLTQLRTVNECHHKSSSLNLNCNIGQRIRILESFYGVATDSNRDYCSEGFKEKDCRSYTSFQNACNGRSTCSVHFYQLFLSECNANSNYLTVLYECVPESRVHGVCSNTEDISSWGTLRTTDFPQAYSSNEDCWCKLVADNNQRIVLSVISFQLFPFDPTCSQAGLYLQSDRKRSKECTFLQQGHYYISSSRNLYLNFYSKNAIARGGFWIIYEASDGKSKIHLKCGDTDEVRPVDFTRYSTRNNGLLTPHVTDKLITSTPKPITNTFNLLNRRTKTSNMEITTADFNLNTTTRITKPSPSTITTTSTKTNRVSLKTKKNNTISRIRFKTTMISTTATATYSTQTKTLYTEPFTSSVKPIIKATNYYSTNNTSTTVTTTLHTFIATSTAITTKLSTDIYTSTVMNSTPHTYISTTIVITSTPSKVIYTPTTIATTPSKDGSTASIVATESYYLRKNNSDSNQTEYMSAVSEQDDKNKTFDIKSIKRLSNRKLTRTELIILVSCVLFITLLTLINLLIYTLKKYAKKSGKGVVEASLNGDADKKSYDILPGVGEIVLWADQDKRGYLIDINGSWAKIDGQRWIRDNMAVIHNTYKKASMAYRNKFKRKDEKKSVVPKEDPRLNKRAPPTNGVYSLPPVPEAVEYEISDSASSSFRIQEDSNTIEAEYHIEEGCVTSISNKKPKMLCQASSSYSITNEHKVNSNPYDESSVSNFYQENPEPYSHPDNYSHEPNVVDVASSDTDTDSVPVIKRPILIRGDTEFLKNHPSSYNTENSVIDTTKRHGVKLDPSILKYSNQPVAIVAPTKSNTNTLERSKHKNIHLTHKHEEIEYEVSRPHHASSITFTNEIEYISSSSSSSITDSSESEPTPVKTQKKFDDSGLGELDTSPSKNTVFFDNNEKEFDLYERRLSKALHKVSLIETMMTKTGYTENKQKDVLNLDEFQFFINAVEKLKAAHLFHEDDLKKMTDEQIYDALVAHARKQRNTNQESPNSSISQIDKEHDEDLPIIMRNLHSVKSLKHFFEIRAKSCSNNDQLQLQASNCSSPVGLKREDKIAKTSMLQDMFVKKSIQEGVGAVSLEIVEPNTVSSTVSSTSAKQIPSKILSTLALTENSTAAYTSSSTRTDTSTSMVASTVTFTANDTVASKLSYTVDSTVSTTPVAPPLPDFLSNPKPNLNLKIKTSESVYSSMYSSLSNPSQDLHEKLIKEIHNKSLERSKKDCSLYLDEHGNIINKPVNRALSSNNQKLSKIKDCQTSLNYSQSNIAEKISQLTQRSNIPETKPNSFRYNKNSIVPKAQFNPIVENNHSYRFEPSVVNEEILYDQNRNMSFRSDFSRVSNSSVVSTRSMLSEAKAKLEAFGRHSRQNSKNVNLSKRHDLNESKVSQSYYNDEQIYNESDEDYLQTKF